MSRFQSNPSDLAEFVRLLTDHQAVLRGYLRTLVPHEADLRDILQNTNLALWERRETFEPGTNFKAWSFAIARFRVLEYRKKLQREHKLAFSAGLIDMLGEAWEQRDADSVERELRALDECLGGLRTKDRALIAARYDSQTPLAEYAKTDGRSEPSLRVALNRLRTILRDCINAKLSGERGMA